MNTKEIINAVAKEIEDKGGIRQVFLVACGGSLVDMYPAKYFLDSEATTLHVGMYTANEFVYATPKRWGEFAGYRLFARGQHARIRRCG